ncbi:hypothetical protein [Bacillus sp. FJAT-22090]|nr:hypothetical protein [Bacillus sp. FJAT-22090]
MDAKERLIWYCQLVLKGYTSNEANEIIDEAIKEYKAKNNNQ